MLPVHVAERMQSARGIPTGRRLPIRRPLRAFPRSKPTPNTIDGTKPATKKITRSLAAGFTYCPSCGYAITYRLPRFPLSGSLLSFPALTSSPTAV